MGLFDMKPEPKQRRTKRGQFTKKVSPKADKILNKIGSKKFTRKSYLSGAAERNGLRNIPYSPQGFPIFSPKTTKEPLQPMGLKAKKKWRASEQKILNKRRMVAKKRREAGNRKVLRKAWKSIW